MEIGNVTFDCSDPVVLSKFWSQLVDRPVAEGASAAFAMIGGQPNLLFINVPEGKSAKNRCHVDLTADAPLAEIRTRLESLGATFVHEKSEVGISWLTFLDLEGNEFCVGQH